MEELDNEGVIEFADPVGGGKQAVGRLDWLPCTAA